MCVKTKAYKGKRSINSVSKTGGMNIGSRNLEPADQDSPVG